MSPRVSVVATAALTIFDGQAVFQLFAQTDARVDRLFRLRRGSRLLAVKDASS